MKKIIFFIFLLFCCFAKKENYSILKIKGEATQYVSPDEIVFNFTISSMEKSVKKTIQKLEKNLSNLKQSIKKANLKLEDLKSSSYHVNKRYNYQNSKKKLIGYEANIRLSITVKNNLKKINSLLIQFYSLDNLEVNISYHLSESKAKSLKEKLIKEAIQNAKFDAKLLAKTSGVKLQKIKKIEYNTEKIASYPRNHRAMEMMSKASSISSSIANSEIKVTELVYLTWYIE